MRGSVQPHARSDRPRDDRKSWERRKNRQQRSPRRATPHTCAHGLERVRTMADGGARLCGGTRSVCCGSRLRCLPPLATLSLRCTTDKTSRSNSSRSSERHAYGSGSTLAPRRGGCSGRGRRSGRRSLRRRWSWSRRRAERSTRQNADIFACLEVSTARMAADRRSHLGVGASVGDGVGAAVGLKESRQQTADISACLGGSRTTEMCP